MKLFLLHFHKIFDLQLVWSKEATRSRDSYPKFVTNIKSNLPRYCEYESLPSNWVNADWDPTFSRVKQSGTPLQLSQHGVYITFYSFLEFADIYKDFIIPCWLSWCEVSIAVNSVDMETHSVDGTETLFRVSHCEKIENLTMFGKFKNKMENTQKPYIQYPLININLIHAKNTTKNLV
jgi:hypothetical protein